MPASPAARLQSYFRAVLEPKREAVPAGAYVLYVHPRDSHPAHNYAIPRAGATSGDGRELVRVARERARQPRLECLEECFAWVQGALAPCGFELEGRHPLMVCAPQQLAPPEVEVDIRPVAPELVGPMLAVQKAAFGEPPPTRESVAGWSGDAVVALHDGEVVGAAAFTAVIDGLSEIVGVAVSSACRRRGLGAALTAAAAGAAYRRGAQLAVLTPGEEASGRVYERVGFRSSATMVHLSVPEPRAAPAQATG